ncbi:ABC transporter ATP-binding protein [Mycolicibacterium sp. 018/SC-01/001]|uniref:ABC transporter ATP-binding protein n=1 Tax=Mycolicibacterium sp. 018/SC-01/001 TaxID=2592069 RepID=UPI00117CC635|nr:ABC transporter ATP-binding protein [Mycolicibacterium sp. 018/SC-01/001]TRW79690.1 ABC transporter ATP-binding protein [Mycolicibacterium sp. 018/SC-01/001]
MTDSRLGADNVSLSYGDTAIVADLTLAIPDGRITMIVGPNACGKSTLLRGLARLLRTAAGRVVLDGTDIATMHTKEVARRLGLLPQTSIAPEGITVADLVARGRFPHQKLLRQWSVDDEKAVTEAMTLTGVSELADRFVDELSGGQRQRVWVAMVLAQQTPVLLLDEPTTYLDIAHQVELLDLFAMLNRTHGHTVVAVLHDLNHACRYADEIVVMKAGRIVDHGDPRTVVTAELIADVYGLSCQIIDDPQTGTPLIVPRASPYLTVDR